MGRNTARMIAGLGAFMNGYAKGQSVGLELKKARREQEMLEQIGAVDNNYTPTETPVASGEEALSAAQQARDQAMAGASDDAQRKQVETDYQPTLSALEAKRSTPASVIRSMGIGQDFRQAESFTADEVSGTKARAKSSIYSAAGREDDAARVMRNESARRELADNEELRAVMNGRSHRTLMANSATDLSDVVNGNPPQSATGADARLNVIRTQGTDEPIQRQKDGEASKAYYERKAPAIIDTLLKQGKTEEAKRYRDFVDSENGRAYTERWSRGVRKFSIGDHDGALSDWQKLYNDQLYDDGYSVKLNKLNDGQVQVVQYDKAGTKLGERTMPLSALAYQAGLALAPEKLVEMRAKAEETRQREAATLNKSIELERLRQQGQDSRDDRREERLQMRLDAQGRQLDRRLEVQGRRGGLTQAQQRSNFEIDAAREMVAGLSDEDIRQRTAPTTATGRENPLYDGALARAAKLASRRKIGDDEDFDARTGRQPAAQPAAGGKPAASAKPAGTPIARAKAWIESNPDPRFKGATTGRRRGDGAFMLHDASGKELGWLETYK